MAPRCRLDDGSTLDTAATLPRMTVTEEPTRPTAPVTPATPAPARPSQPLDAMDVDPGRGLSEAEVQARRAKGQGNKAPPGTTRSYRSIVIENSFTFVNDVLFLLAMALVVVGRPLDALISIAVIGTNVVVAIFQEIRAKQTLDKIAILAQPTATVRRDGTDRVVRPEELVLGDLVHLTLGDQIVLDGRLTAGEAEVDESQLTGESDAIHKSAGDTVSSGSFCMSGSGWYEVTAVGVNSYTNRITADAKGFRRVLTPVQKEVHLVIRITLAIVVYLQVLLILQAVSARVEVPQAVGQATILAGLVPNGLFVSIAIAYALAAVRIARMGALVQQSNAVESLSHVDTLCLDKTGTLTTTDFKVDQWHALDGNVEALQRVLGTVVASARTRNRTAEAIAAASPASAMATTADLPFSSARRYSAVAVTGPLTASGSSGSAGDGSAPVAVGSAAPTDPTATAHEIAPGVYALGAPQSLLPRVLAHGSDEAAKAIEDLTHEWASKGLRVLLLTYNADPSALNPDADDPLPPTLQPIGMVGLVDVLRPEAKETLQRFRNAGVTVRIISGDDPETVAALARQAGLEVGAHSLVNGADLAGKSPEQLAHAVNNARIFGRVAPSLKAELVDALKEAGHYVAMIGDGVNDILSLKKSNLAVAMGAGTQATKGVADLILLDDSFGSLASAVEEGNRIRNGMHDILRLFLTRIAALGLVIVSALVVGEFPVELRNASAITIFTVGVPSILLAVWAPGGRSSDEPLVQTLIDFVVPAAAMSALIGLLIFYGTLLIDPVEVGVGGPAPLALSEARSALTSFLVLSGLLLVPFVAPPTHWFAVVDPPADDLRPAVLTIILAVAYFVVMLTPLGRTLFDLVPLRGTAIVLVAIGALVWLVVVRTVWKSRIIHRFVSM
jgi:cation-transporting ATPase E